MSVLKGEGKVPILFGSTSIAAGNRTHVGYLARPDLTGEWPTVLVIHSLFGISSSVKDICRRIARQGFAAIAVDLFGGRGPARGSEKEAFIAASDALDETDVQRNLLDIVAYISNPAGFWSSGEFGFGVLALGSGVRFTPGVAMIAQPAGLGLAYAPLTEELSAGLAGYTGSILGVWGSDDSVADLDVARTLRTTQPRTEIVLYGDVGHAFLDDGHDDYDFVAAGDALDRLSEFFAKLLPPPPA